MEVNFVRSMGPWNALVILASLWAAGTATAVASAVGHTSGEAGIARLWARERIAELGRQKRLDAQPRPGEGDYDARMLELALRFGLVSEHTSLVAVDVTPARPAGVQDRTAQAPTSAPADGAWARSTGFPATATHAPFWLLFGFLALLLAVALTGPWIYSGRCKWPASPA